MMTDLNTHVLTVTSRQVDKSTCHVSYKIGISNNKLIDIFIYLNKIKILLCEMMINRERILFFLTTAALHLTKSNLYQLMQKISNCGLRACIETAKLIGFIVYLFGQYTISPSIFAKNRNFS